MTPRAIGLFLLLPTAVDRGSDWPPPNRQPDELPPYAAREPAGAR